MKIVIGTRGSALALAQSEEAAARVRALGHEAELEIIKTMGDARQDRAFSEVGEPGVFVREIETALLESRVDMAVHSYKDLPSQSPDGLAVAAVPLREDPVDVLLVAPGRATDREALIPLPGGACVGTASARRRSLIEHYRPDLRVEMLRGNVPTRVRRLREGRFDAILLASAGLRRLAAASGEDLAAGLDRVALDPDRFVPAPTQGALAYQTRSEGEARDIVARLDDAASRRPVLAERDILARVQGGCEVPFGAWCRSRDDVLEMTAFLERDGGVAFARASHGDPVALGAAVWDGLQGEAARTP